MKSNKNQTVFHKLMGFVRGELEITLAILVLLALVVGSTFAQTPTPTPGSGSDVTASATETSSSLVYNGRTYTGVAFGVGKTGHLTVKGMSTTAGASQYATSDGLTLVKSDATYTLELALDKTLDATAWYVDFDGSTPVLVNGISVATRNQAIDLSGATSIKIEAKGGTTMHTFSHVSGSATAAPTVAALYLAPSGTTLTVGATRNFITVATDADSNSVSVAGRVTWTTSNKAVASVNGSTGLVTALTPGTVTITAKVDEATASATVTVEAAPAPITNPTGSNSTTTTNTTPTKNSWGEDWNLSTPAPSAPTATDTAPAAATPTQTATVEQAITSLFSPAAVAARVVAGVSSNPTQAQITATAKTIASPVGQVAFRIRAAVAEVATTLQEIAFGRTVVDPSTGQPITKPSAIKIIAGFIGNLISGGNPGTSAGTLKAGPGDADLE
jgi:hypothetical protein